MAQQLPLLSDFLKKIAPLDHDVPTTPAFTKHLFAAAAELAKAARQLKKEMPDKDYWRHVFPLALHKFLVMCDPHAAYSACSELIDLIKLKHIDDVTNRTPEAP